MEAATPWWPAVSAFALGLVVAAWTVALLSRRRETAEASDTPLIDLEERASQLVQLLRDLEEQRSRLNPASYSEQKARLEALAAGALRLRDEKAKALAVPKPKKKAPGEVDKVAAASGSSPLEWLAARPGLRGFLGGVLTVGIIGGIFALLLSEQSERPEGGSATGRQMGRGMGAPNPQGDPELNGLLTHLRESPNDNEAVVRLVHRLLQLQLADEARQVNEHAQELDPHHPETRVHAAIVRANGGDLPGALADLDAVVQAHPSFAEGWLARGSLAMQGKDETLARASWQRFVEVASEGPQKDRVKAFLAGEASPLPADHPPIAGGGALGGPMGGAGPAAGGVGPMGAPAGSELESLLEQSRALLRQQRIDEAIPLNARAKAIAPNDPEVRVHAAVIKIAGGEMDGGLKELDAVLGQNPRLADGWFFRGMVGMMTQRPELTKESWEKFVAVAPEGPRKERIRGFLRGDGLQMPQP